MALKYHSGQIEVQTEANTRRVADMLAAWVGPVGEFCRTADMIVLATADDAQRLAFFALSGEAPIVDVTGPASVLLRLDAGQGPSPDGAIACGGLAIGLAVARRARLNGTLTRTDDGLLLQASEAFTNCRKYVAPSTPLEKARHTGPDSRTGLAVTDSRIAAILAAAETAFLASVSPEGGIDVSHRGGPPGFLRWDGSSALDWDEYVGDGMLKSAGNIRSNGRFSLLVPDMATGDAVELSGVARVEMVQRDKRPRTDSLLQHAEDFPVQGAMSCEVAAAFYLRGVTHPRQRIEKRQRITSASTTNEQAPQ